MLDYQGHGHGNFTARKWFHNLRIECLWLIVFQSCIQLFYHLFHFMEDEMILNTMFFYKALDLFAGAWNNHGLDSRCGSSG